MSFARRISPGLCFGPVAPAAALALASFSCLSCHRKNTVAGAAREEREKETVPSGSMQKSEKSRPKDREHARDEVVRAGVAPGHSDAQSDRSTRSDRANDHSRAGRRVEHPRVAHGSTRVSLGCPPWTGRGFPAAHLSRPVTYVLLLQCLWWGSANAARTLTEKSLIILVLLNLEALVLAPVGNTHQPPCTRSGDGVEEHTSS